MQGPPERSREDVKLGLPPTQKVARGDTRPVFLRVRDQTPVAVGVGDDELHRGGRIFENHIRGSGFLPLPPVICQNRDTVVGRDVVHRNGGLRQKAVPFEHGMLVIYVGHSHLPILKGSSGQAVHDPPKGVEISPLHRAAGRNDTSHTPRSIVLVARLSIVRIHHALAADRDDMVEPLPDQAATFGELTRLPASPAGLGIDIFGLRKPCQFPWTLGRCTERGAVRRCGQDETELNLDRTHAVAGVQILRGSRNDVSRKGDT